MTGSSDTILVMDRLWQVPMPVPCANVVLTKAKDWPGASSFMGKDEKKCLIPGADSADNAE